MNEKKVLLIAHNVFDCRTNMGKTLSSFFTNYNADSLAELYFHTEVPTMNICHRYYRVTDTDALKSWLPGNRKQVGKAFFEADIDVNRSSAREDSGIKRKIYSLGSKRTSFIYFARNTLWCLSSWYSDELKKWIAEFSPDIIFFAAGDYAFAYDIAYTISKDFDIPMIMYCCDDFFINRRNPHSLLGIFVHRYLMQSVRRSASRTAAVITICDKMSDAYRTLFDKPMYTAYTGYSTKNELAVDGKGIVYLGNLACGRSHSLIEIGQALKRISERIEEPLYLDVYSGENRPEVLQEMTTANGIRFWGAVDTAEVKNIITKCRLAIHTESFIPEHKQTVMYSISTKIADLLASGRCIFAYGPGEVASMEYLRENQAACVVNDPALLEKELEDILNNGKRRKEIVASAQILSERNHNMKMVQQQIKKIINDSCVRKEVNC